MKVSTKVVQDHAAAASVMFTGQHRNEYQDF